MEEGNHQLFRQYERFNGDTFLDYLKIIHSRFPRCYLFMDKASPHYKSKKVLKYFEENKNDLIPQHIFQLHHHRVYGYRRDMEHSKTRSAGAKILSIVCRF